MGYPIERVSFSSFRSFVTNPSEFKENYILKNGEYKKSPAMLVGQMAHGVLEAFFNWTPIEVSVPKAIEMLDAIPNEDIEFGKTGSRENIVKDFHNAVKHYFEEMPEYGKILSVEEFLEGEVSDVIDGATIVSPLPFCGKCDLVYEKGSKIVIEDYKFVSSFKDPTIENPAYVFQAFFYYYLSFKKFGRYADECVFREVKLSKNKDGSSQHNLIRVPFSGETFEMNKVYFWYNLSQFFKLIENTDADSIFMENIFDMVNGPKNFERQKRTVFGYKREEIKGTEFSVVEERGEKVVRYIEEAQASTVQEKIAYKLQDHGVSLKFESIESGYAFDRYLFTPGRGTKMKDVSSKEPEVCQALGAKSVRIIAPVPGTTFVGIEVPKAERVFAKIEKFEDKWILPIPIGMEIGWIRHVADLGDSNTPHVIVVWRTGSGKSEMLKVIVKSLIGRSELTLIDPKRTELKPFAKHGQYVQTAEEAEIALYLLASEMDRRYEVLSKENKSDIRQTDWKHHVVVIEEYADLVFSDNGKQIEKLLLRLSNLGRAAGIHIVLSTQRPDVKIVTGALKANIGARVCFATASQVDSKVTLDEAGAENLLWKGDMLYRNPGHPLVRLQGFYA